MKVLYKTDFIVSRKESNFDRACEEALKHALIILGADEDGYLKKVEGWERSTDSIEINFIRLSMMGGFMGWSYCYEFVCTVYRS